MNKSSEQKEFHGHAVWTSLQTSRMNVERQIAPLLSRGNRGAILLVHFGNRDDTHLSREYHCLDGGEKILHTAKINRKIVYIAAD